MSTRSLNSFEITVDKGTLMLTVKKNREEHIASYKEAMEVYEEECREDLQNRLDVLEAGEHDDPDRYLSFSVDTPISYAHVYDQLIAMLDLTDADTLTINGSQYRNWMQDDWDWSSTYSARTLSKLG
jgi:hypothetical protein